MDVRCSSESSHNGNTLAIKTYLARRILDHIATPYLAAAMTRPEFAHVDDCQPA